MATYTLQGPDGKTYTVEGPDGATAEQLGAFVTSQADSSPIPQAPSQPIAPGKSSGILQQAGNVAAGALRGAGSIGATLLAPYDIAKDAISGRGLSLQSNRERRSAMDGGLEQMGAQPDSFAYGAGKIGGEIAGTLGAGGAAANVISKLAPSASKIAPGLIEALRSGGMNANGATGLSGMATRVAGGAANGAVSSGLVDPENVPLGAAIGGVAPVAVKAAGMVGEKIGDKVAQRLANSLKEFNASGQSNRAIEDSIKAGYIIPPATVDPTFANKLMESISGKQATQQIASTQNNKVTEGLVRKSLGLSEDTPISTSALENLRKTAGTAYKEVSDISPQAAADLEALKTARNEAQGWFKAYNRSARPDDLAKAKDARVLSDQLEQALETHATQAGRPELVPALRDARKQIAKTYTVSRALNDATGNVDARVLGRMFEKGLPLSDGLDTAGRFGSAFPSIAKTPQQIGSPDTHNLKSIASLLMGGGGAAALGPAGLAAGAAPFIAPPMARALMFREGAQKALIPQAPQESEAVKRLAALLKNPQAQELLSKSIPTIGVSSGP